MNFPCPNVIDCPGVDFPVENYSAEDPDKLLYFSEFDYSNIGDVSIGQDFRCTECHAICTSEVSQQEADDCARREAASCALDCIIDPTPEPINKVWFPNRAQTCTISCETGQTVDFKDASVLGLPGGRLIQDPTGIYATYTVPADLIRGESQLDADTQAYELACILVQYFCVHIADPLFGSRAQTCNHICPDGSTVSFTVPPNLFIRTTQIDADNEAYNMACLLASGLCPTGQLYQNTDQTCIVTCGDGSTQTYTVIAAKMSGATQAEADQKAYQLACDLAQMKCQTLPAGMFWNTEQTCSHVCLDGSISSYTVPANVCIDETQSAADAQAYRLACLLATMGCGPPSLFLSNAQDCTATCDDGSTRTYHLDAGYFPANTQADSDHQAYDFACRLAKLQCSQTPTFYPNTSQSCTVTCDDGNTRTYTMPAGVVIEMTQADADKIAYDLACAWANTLCTQPPNPDPPPLPPIIPPVTPENPPVNPPTPQKFYNDLQIGRCYCPDGSTFYYSLPAGTVVSTSKAKANTLAQSIADHRACLRKACISIGVFQFCVGKSADQRCTVSGGQGPFTWNFESGLPNGISLIPLDAEARHVSFAGVATTPGVIQSFITLTDKNGNYLSHTGYFLTVLVTSMGFVGEVLQPFTAQLTAIGVPGPQVWSLWSGTLPPGLVLASDGSITGVPLVDGTFTFWAQVIVDGLVTCVEQYTAVIDPAPYPP